MPGIELKNTTVAALLALTTLVLLVVTAPSIGLTWDEPSYIAAAESYVGWFKLLVTSPLEAFDAETLTYHWEPNREHPPLGKVWEGLIWSASRFVVDDLTAHRMGNMLLVSGLVALLYLAVARTYGRVAGLGAVAALVTMPRFFLHAHLAALDIPATVAVFGVLVLFWYARDRRGLWWHVLPGLAFGLALATKINAVFIPPTLFLWALVFSRKRETFIRIVTMGLIALPVFVLAWPYLYRSFWARLIEYLRFITVGHWNLGQWYLGAYHQPPPWHFPLVLLVAVVPLSVMVLSGFGVGRVIRERNEHDLGGLFLAGAVVPLLALTTGLSKVYDNDRLFLPSMPFLAALAGIGLAWALGRFRAPAQRVMLLGAVFLPHVLFAIGVYPHLLSYYSETVGGLRVASRLGLEHTYWCETYAAALPYLNQHAPPGATVWVENWSYDVLLYYQLHERLRPDLKVRWNRGARTALVREGAQGYEVPIEHADYVVLQYRQTGFNPDVRRWLAGGREPVFRLEYRDVPLMDIYEQ